MTPVISKLIITAALICSVEPMAAQTNPAYFTVYSVPTDGTSASQQFVVKITDPAIIQEARAALSESDTHSVHVIGTVVKAPAYFNAPWGFHLDPASIGFFNFAAEVCDAATSYVQDHLSETGEAFLPDNVWCPWGSYLLAEVAEPAGAAQYLRLASAASDREASISPGTLISIYGQNLTDTWEEVGSGQPPLSLAGVTVQMTAAGQTTSYALPLLFASASKVTALIPADVPLGAVSVSLKNSSGLQFNGKTYLESIAPALFTMPLENQNYAAASVLRIRADGTRTVESLAAVSAVDGSLAPLPVEFGLPGDELYLSLYGTGFSNIQAGSVSVTLASEDTKVLYVGPQGGMAGLDQINIPIAQSLKGQPFLDIQFIARNSRGYPVKTNVARVLLSGGQ
jgi:uncharacterized protein (TIGR03437 family)